MPIKNIAIACQGGGSHAAFAAGALPVLLPQFRNAELATSQGRAKLADEAQDVLRLTGISGTSGGAISALLAWYGYLLGGPEAAKAGLERFWDANCAIAPGERLLNDIGQWAGSLSQVDLKLSPYLSPLREIETFATATWPMLTAMWPPLGSWIRGPYFQLRESIAPHVDFDLVGAIGDFCSIPQEIKRWQAIALEARMADTPPERERLQARQAAIEHDLRARLASGGWIAAWSKAHELAAGSLLRKWPSSKPLMPASTIRASVSGPTTSRSRWCASCSTARRSAARCARSWDCSPNSTATRNWPRPCWRTGGSRPGATWRCAPNPAPCGRPWPGRWA
ncbi:patatin-like phospholipase family protein [Massilia sp. CFBP9026]|uniref:patatin-like phospholipase family protein n=1 Tax=Massilia sp. CFBP9026 TaxID=3096536 RepID=UPI002A6A771D|nr:patatin-like phospholipase family protein [Massilia sp. CFBP9026]MDY0964827.1 hypothetical protein [Massilia sp. CFBP9026]